MSEGWETLDAGAHADNQLPLHASPRPSGLREAREATGLHIAALAAALKVPVKKLEALEAGRYDELPDLTFARALASSACRHLKIDAGPILGSFPQAHMPMLGSPSARDNATFKGEAMASSSSLANGLKSPAFLIAGAVLFAALVLALVPDWKQWPGKTWFEQGSTWIEGLTQSADSKAPDPGTSEASGATVLGGTEAQTPLESSSVEAQGVDVKPATLKSATGLSEETTLPTPATGVVLHLEATSDSWVEVIDGAGKVQIQRVMRQGDAMDFSSTPPYSVVLGRADAVNVLVRGAAFDVAPFARNSVARFQVK